LPAFYAADSNVVKKTGSTMTGKLILNDGLDVNGITFNELGTGIYKSNHLNKYENVKTFVSQPGNVAGKIRVELPITSQTMWTVIVDLFEYGGSDTSNIKTTKIRLTGYSYSNDGMRSVWCDNPDRIFKVEWGRNSANNRTVLLITPVSTFSFPKATISEVLTHNSFSAGMSNSSNYAIDITTDETDFTLLGTILNSGFLRDSYYAAKTDYATATTGGTVKMRISGSDLFITNNGTNP